jgi:hypothetical protein
VSAMALLLLLFVLSRSGGGGRGDWDRTVQKPKELPYSPVPMPSPSEVGPKSPAASAAKQKPPPWPQAVPAGLPPWGRAGWEPDNPPPFAVQTRAQQLLPQLWKYGPYIRKTENTAGRWITFQSEPMGKKKGVVAYRVRDGAMPQPATQTDTSTPMV